MDSLSVLMFIANLACASWNLHVGNSALASASFGMAAFVGVNAICNALKAGR